VKFYGEEGIDQGGVKKEYFMLLLRQLFDLNYGMFTYYPVKYLFIVENSFVLVQSFLFRNEAKV